MGGGKVSDHSRLWWAELRAQGMPRSSGKVHMCHMG